MQNIDIIDSLIDQSPDTIITDFQIYERCIYIESDKVGLASRSDNNNISYTSHNFLKKNETKSVKGHAKYFRSNSYIEAAMGLAAINSYINQPEKMPKEKTANINAIEILKKQCVNKNISIIGGFPFINTFRDNYKYKNLWVFEINPKNEYELSPLKFSDYLPQSDLVLISASTLVNKTFFEIVPMIKNSYNILVGPSTPLSPMFSKYHINVLGGAIVNDKQNVKIELSKGKRFRSIKGLSPITYFL